MFKYRSILAVLSAVGAIGVANAADYTMRISHQFPPAHHSAKNFDQFAKEVEAATNGKVDVQIFGAAQLFKPNQNHMAVAGGKIEAAAILSFQWGKTIPEMSVTIIPYIMPTVEKIKAFVGSPASKLLDQKLKEKGVINLAWVMDANTGIFTSNSRPLAAPADFKGVKMRGLNKLFDAGLTAMGASALAMPGSEVYQALQTGVLDAALTGVDAAYSRKYFEVQKYGVASNVILAYDNLVVNPQWWNGLPADIRAAIQKAADAAVARSIPAKSGVPQASLDVLAAKGMQVKALDQKQQEVMARAMQPAVIKDFLQASGADGEKLLKLIQAL